MPCGNAGSAIIRPWADNLTRAAFYPHNNGRSGEEEHTAIAECDLRSECGPKRAHDDARDEIADAVDGSENAERHAMMALVN